MKKTQTFLLLVLLCTSCVSTYQARDIVGTYESKEKLYACNLILKADGTFEYSGRGDLLNHQSTGTWKLLQDTITLTSFKAPGIKEVEEEVNSSLDSLLIEVWGTWDDTTTLLPVGLGTVDVYKDILGREFIESIQLNQDGVGFMRQQTVGQMIVRFLTEAYSYRVQNSNANKFKIVVSFKNSGYMYFDSDRWKLDGNHIVAGQDLILRKVSN